jgi:hypothetical protein
LERWPPRYPGSDGIRTSEELLRRLAKNRPVNSAFSKLSDEELKQLIGWIVFGRDYAGAENPVEQLAACIAEANVSDRKAAIVYAADKPIHKYLQKAEKTLRNYKASTPVDAGR